MKIHMHVHKTLPAVLPISSIKGWSNKGCGGCSQQHAHACSMRACARMCTHRLKPGIQSMPKLVVELHNCSHRSLHRSSGPSCNQANKYSSTVHMWSLLPWLHAQVHSTTQHSTTQHSTLCYTSYRLCSLMRMPGAWFVSCADGQSLRWIVGVLCFV